jgi:hypothetical protein
LAVDAMLLEQGLQIRDVLPLGMNDETALGGRDLQVYWFSVNGKFAFEGLAWLRDRANR